MSRAKVVRRKPPPPRFDSASEARMYRYHHLLLEARTHDQAALWFDQFLRYKALFDERFILTPNNEKEHPT